MQESQRDTDIKHRLLGCLGEGKRQMISIALKYVYYYM